MPRVDVYDEVGDGEEVDDERRILDAAPRATIGAQRLAPPPSQASEMASKLAKGEFVSAYLHYLLPRR